MERPAADSGPVQRLPICTQCNTICAKAGLADVSLGPVRQRVDDLAPDDWKEPGLSAHRRLIVKMAPAVTAAQVDDTQAIPALLARVCDVSYSFSRGPAERGAEVEAHVVDVTVCEGDIRWEKNRLEHAVVGQGDADELLDLLGMLGRWCRFA